MDNEKDEKNSSSILNKINYYKEKTEENLSLCKKVTIFSFFLFCLTLICDSQNNSNITTFLIIAFVAWLEIMFLIRKDYSNKIKYSADNNSLVKCKNCGKYKYADKKCSSCGYDSVLKTEDKAKLLEFYNARIVLIRLLCFFIVAFIIIGDIMLIASIYGTGDNLLALYLFTAGNPSIVLPGLLGIGFLLCFFVILGFNNMANNFYTKKKLLLGKDSKKPDQNKDE